MKTQLFFQSYENWHLVILIKYFQISVKFCLQFWLLNFNWKLKKNISLFLKCFFKNNLLVLNKSFNWTKLYEKMYRNLRHGLVTVPWLQNTTFPGKDKWMIKNYSLCRMSTRGFNDRRAVKLRWILKSLKFSLLNVSWCCLGLVLWKHFIKI